MNTRPQRTFALNDIFYDVCILEYKRGFQILDDEANVGRVITGEMQRDIIGTFDTWSYEICSWGNAQDAFESLLNAIRQPVDSFRLKIWNGTEYETHNAYITSAEPSLKYDENLRIKYVGSMSLKFVAMTATLTH